MDFVVTFTDLINMAVLGFGMAIVALAVAWHYVATLISGVKAKLSARKQGDDE